MTPSDCLRRPPPLELGDRIAIVGPIELGGTLASRRPSTRPGHTRYLSIDQAAVQA